MPPPGNDVITGHAPRLHLGCFDRPGGHFFIFPTFADHQDLRAEHPELVKGWATGIRYYHSVASCPHL
jgi:hypothetical protein